jgi:hypothetical protein
MRTEIKTIKSTRRARELAGGPLGSTRSSVTGGGGGEGDDISAEIASQRGLIGDLKTEVLPRMSVVCACLCVALF